MKFVQYGTTIVVIHAIAHGMHGLAHEKIPVSLSVLQSLFVGAVVVLVPIISAFLLWTKFYRIGSWLLLSSMAGVLLFGIYDHFIVIEPEHVSQNSFKGWVLLFQVTALLMLIADGFGCGCGISVWASKAVPQKDKKRGFYEFSR